jgi:hypothetical protein
MNYCVNTIFKNMFFFFFFLGTILYHIIIMWSLMSHFTSCYCLVFALTIVSVKPVLISTEIRINVISENEH